MPDQVDQQLLQLLSTRRGHFQYESGHHGDLWLDLDALFTRPAALRPITDELARRLATHGIQAVCGPMAGGALVAKMVAERLGIEFFFTERIATGDDLGVTYRLPKAHWPVVRGKSVALVDDAINAGSAISGTLTELRAAGANPVAIGALVVLGTGAATIATAQKMPLELIAQLSSRLWPPANCPQCAAGVPLGNGDASA